MRTLLVVLAIAVSVTGCGGSSSGGVVGADPGAQGLEEAVRARNNAQYTGDWTLLRSTLTDECREQWGEGDLASTLSAALLFAAAGMGIDLDDLDQLRVGDVVIDELVEGERAVVRGSLERDGELFIAVDPEDEGSVYVYEGGRWRSQGCEFGLGS